MPDPIEVRGHERATYRCHDCGSEVAETVRRPGPLRPNAGASVARMTQRTRNVENTLPLSAMERFYTQRINGELRDDLVELLEELAG